MTLEDARIAARDSLIAEAVEMGQSLTLAQGMRLSDAALTGARPELRLLVLAEVRSRVSDAIAAHGPAANPVHYLGSALADLLDAEMARAAQEAGV